MKKQTLWVGSEVVRWVVDEHARRVPLYVIEHTGLATKKEIEAKYGYGAVFDKVSPTKATVTKGEIEKPAPKKKPAKKVTKANGGAKKPAKKKAKPATRPGKGKPMKKAIVIVPKPAKKAAPVPAPEAAGA